MNQDAGTALEPSRPCALVAIATKVITAIIVAPVMFLIFGIMLLILGIPHNQYVRGQTQEFCAQFQIGLPADSADITRQANEMGYRVKGLGESSLWIYKYSWTGTMWNCTIKTEGGRITEVRFFGISLAH